MKMPSAKTWQIVALTLGAVFVANQFDATKGITNKLTGNGNKFFK